MIIMYVIIKQDVPLIKINSVSNYRPKWTSICQLFYSSLLICVRLVFLFDDLRVRDFFQSKLVLSTAFLVLVILKDSTVLLSLIHI